jgi:hypothetical protein
MDRRRVEMDSDNFKSNDFKGNDHHYWGGNASHSLTSLLLNGHSYHGTLMDVSLAGALFMPDKRIGKIDRSVCRIDIREISGEPVVLLSGIVIHSENQLLVVKFTALSSEQYSALSHEHDMSGNPPELLWRGIAELVKSVSTPVVPKGFLQRRQFDRRKLGTSTGLI